MYNLEKKQDRQRMFLFIVELFANVKCSIHIFSLGISAM